jgi:hypothetical protein
MRFLLIFFGLWSFLWAQLEVRLSQMDREQWPEVVLYVSVSLEGKPLTTLSLADFQGKEKEPILFQKDFQTVQHYHTLLLIDVSPLWGKMPFIQVQKALSTFVALKQKEDRIGLYSFSSRWDKVASPSLNLYFLKKSIDSMALQTGGSEYFFALSQTFPELKKLSGRTSLFLITAGKDKSRWHNPLRKEGVLDPFIQEHFSLDIFGVGSAPSLDPQELGLMAEKTQGTFSLVPSVKELSSAFLERHNALLGEYVLRYKSLASLESKEKIPLEIQVQYQGKTAQVSTSYVAGKQEAKVKKFASTTKRDSFQRLEFLVILGTLVLALALLPFLFSLFFSKKDAAKPPPVSPSLNA